MRFIKISIRIWGESLSPDQITEMFSVSPTYSQSRGELKISGDGKNSRRLDLGLWAYTKNVSELNSDEIGAILRPFNGMNIKKIENVDHAILDIYAGFSDENFMVDSSLEFRIDNAIVDMINRMGLDLRITIT